MIVLGTKKRPSGKDPGILFLEFCTQTAMGDAIPEMHARFYPTLQSAGFALHIQTVEN